MPRQTNPPPKTKSNPARPAQLNAVTHGLTATLPLDDQEQQAMERTIADWTLQLGTDTEAERALIHRAAVAHIRLERCTRAESASLQHALDETQKNHIATQRRRIRKVAQNLPDQPAPTLAALESSSYGCEWLLRHWRALDATLAQGLRLTTPQADRFLNLAGYLALPPGPDAPLHARRLWALLFVAFHNGFRFDRTDGLTLSKLGGFQPPPDCVEDPLIARQTLRDLAGDEIRRLETLREQLHDEQDGPEQARLATIGLIDVSPEAQKRQKYEREADRLLNRSLSLLMRIRQDRRREEAAARKDAYRKPPADRPEPKAHLRQNEPIAPPAPLAATPIHPTESRDPAPTQPPLPSSAPSGAPRRTDSSTTTRANPAPWTSGQADDLRPPRLAT